MKPSTLILLSSRVGPELAPPLVAGSWDVLNNDATHIATFANSTLRYQSDTTSPQLLVQKVGILVAGQRYRVRILTGVYTSGSLKTDSLGANTILVTGAGWSEVIGTAAPGATTFSLIRNSTNVDITMYSISVRPYHGP